ncbi:hypothetical protein HAX54_049891 [Datura stramonium]|uniref:Uncharacterized protein n=1 Tax=Datura stramonium TaxID=4076 RepID=A0ABS8WMX6_DATST|nr:hypothetical protein [Datura stramonium]
MASSFQLVDPLGRSGYSVNLAAKDDVVFLRIVSLPHMGRRRNGAQHLLPVLHQWFAQQSFSLRSVQVEPCWRWGICCSKIYSERATELLRDPYAAGKCSMPNRHSGRPHLMHFGLLTKYCFSKYLHCNAVFLDKPQRMWLLVDLMQPKLLVGDA